MGTNNKLREVVTALAYVILPPREEYPAEYGGGKVPDRDGWLAWIRAMQAKARAALAEPPRNCDRFQTTKQAKEAYYVEVRHVSVWDGCETERLVDWLLAPATEKEGGAK